LTLGNQADDAFGKQPKTGEGRAVRPIKLGTGGKNSRKHPKLHVFENGDWRSDFRQHPVIAAIGNDAVPQAK